MAAMSVAQLLAAFDPTLPLERAKTIPAAWYFDPELADLERRVVFAGWQPIARREQLAVVGSYVTADVAGEPVVALLGEDGAMRAFHNICRHRAAVILNEPCGQASKLRCRYHGWTYDLAGRLRGTPEFDGVADFDRADNGLVPLAIDSFGPLVWVHQGQPEVSLREYLRPLVDLLPRIDGLRWAARREYDLACNWKVYVDNYLDGGYHVNTVHPALAGVLDYSKYRTELHDHCNVQVSPLVPDESVGAVRTGDSAYYWWVFPNFMLNLYEGVMDTNVVWPLGPDRCRVVFDFYFADQSEEFVRQSIDVAECVQQEDMQICAEVQRGLHSRSYDTGRFSVRREAGGYHFHRLLAKRLQLAAK